MYQIEVMNSESGEGKVKKGVSDILFVPRWKTETFFKEADRVSFSGVEINFHEDIGILTKTTSLYEANKIAHLAANYNIEINSISSELFKRYSFTSCDSRLRKSGDEIARRMIEFAAEMGVKTINVLPGTLCTEVPYEKFYVNAVESLKRLADEAKKMGIVIGVENTDNHFLPSPKEFIGFLDDIDHRSVKACLNTANALITGFPEHFVESLSDRIIGVHVKDFRKQINSFATVLEGDINWPSILNALYEIPFKGYLISIPSQPHKYGLERHIERYSRDVTALLSLLGPIDIPS